MGIILIEDCGRSFLGFLKKKKKQPQAEIVGRICLDGSLKVVSLLSFQLRACPEIFAVLLSFEKHLLYRYNKYTVFVLETKTATE